MEFENTPQVIAEVATDETTSITVVELIEDLIEETVDESIQEEIEDTSDEVIDESTLAPLQQGEWTTFDDAVNLITELGITNSNLYDFWKASAILSNVVDVPEDNI